MFHVERFSTLLSLCWLANVPRGTLGSPTPCLGAPIVRSGNYVGLPISSPSAGLVEPRRRNVPRGTLVRSVPRGTFVWKDGKEFSVAGFDSTPSANSAVAPKYVIAIAH